MSLKNRNILVPGGWIYNQADNSGKVVKKFKSMAPFAEAAREILKCRVANNFNRATLPQVLEDLDEAQCQRLGYDASFVKKKPVSFSPMRLFSPQHLRGVAAHVAQGIGNLSNGAIILTRWLGSGGKPVESVLSQARSDICTGGLHGLSCPYNESGFKPVDRIADIIRAQTEEKNKLKLTVVGEERLHTCSLCYCSLPLKVHVPLEHSISAMPPSMIQKFRDKKPDCWIIKELDERNKPKQ